MLYFVFLVLVAVACATPGTAKTVYLTVDNEKAPILFNTLKNCADKLGLDSKIIQKVLNWKFDSNDSNFLHCFGNAAGLCNDAGHLIKDNLLLLIGDHKSKDEFSKSIDECDKLEGSNKYDTLFKIVTCLRDSSPILFTL